MYANCEGFISLLVSKHTQPKFYYTFSYGFLMFGVRMDPISTEDRLPANNQYVLARFPGRPWHDRDTDVDHKWVVVKFVLGISLDERAALSDNDERKRAYTAADEHANNHKPYFWDTFGPGSFFGQEADYWCELPKI